MLTKMLDGDNWRSLSRKLAIVFGVFVTIAFGVIITFAWLTLLARGFAVLLSWVS